MASRPARRAAENAGRTVTGYNQGPVSEYTGEAPWICAVEDRDGKAWSSG